MRRPTATLLLLLLAPIASACAREDTLFSDQNARAHIGMLAGTIGSRPVGTPPNARAREYIVDQLRLFGFEVRVQEADARRPTLGRTARVSNIIAVRPGERPEAVGLLSHYDSVPAGPGAADDALGVGVSLEAARVLAAKAKRTWTLMVLITDGEESGLMGASALVTDRDVSRRLQFYMNLEAIGSAGAPMLFEAGPANGWVLRPWGTAAPQPRGGSLSTEIYRYLPSDTDFSILKLHEIPGLNFAAVGDSYAYHTPLDTPDRLSPFTVRRLGHQVVTIADALERVDITQRSPDQRTFFDLAGARGVSYGPIAGTAIALSALLAGVVAWVKVTAVVIRQHGLLRWAFAGFWIVSASSAAVAAMIGATWALRASREVFHPWYARPGRLFLHLVVIALLIAWGAARAGAWLPARARSIREPFLAWSVALPAWIAIGGVALWFAPGAAYLWVWPLLVASVLLLFVPASQGVAARIVSFLAFAVAALFWLRDTHDLLRFMVATFGRLPLVTPVFVHAALIGLAGLMIAPPLAATFSTPRAVRRPALITSLLLLAAAATAAAAYVAPAYTHDEPLRRHLRVFQEAGKPAVWDVASIEPGLDLADSAPPRWTAVTSAPDASLPMRRLPHPFVFRTAAGTLDAAPIGIASLTIQPVAGGLELAISVVPRQSGLTLSFVMPAGVDPARSSLPGIARAGRWTATSVAPPADGVLFRASFSGSPDLRGFRVLATAHGSAADGGWQPPAWLPRERTAWTAEATWVVDPSALPIAPVPPLR
jgi:hypothetical protein